MEDGAPPSTPECVLLEERSGMKLYKLKKTLLLSYEPKIKIITIGDENDLDTRNIFVMGETGAGKTCFINALANHLFGIQFEYNYRYVLEDETGEGLKSQSESQTDYVVGYLIYSPSGSGRNYNYMIIDTPGLNDCRGEQRNQEIVQQIKTFLQGVDGIDELHCISFVVNGTVARFQDKFRDIVDTFCEVLGENVKDIIRILISFGHMKKPPVLEVLENSSLKVYKRYKFDNESLKVCNHPNDEYSEEEVIVSKTFWNSTARVYNSLLDEVDSINAVSLGLTRQTLNAIGSLHKSIDSLKEAVVTYVDLKIDYKELEDESKTHLSGLVPKTESQIDPGKLIFGTIFNAFADVHSNFMHAHLCKDCEQTCCFPCSDYDAGCLKQGMRCSKCSCPSEAHIITTAKDMFNLPLGFCSDAHDDKKDFDKESEKQELLRSKDIANLKNILEEVLGKVDEIMQAVIEQFIQIKTNSLRNVQYSMEEIIHQTLTQVKMEKLTQASAYQDLHEYIEHVIEHLHEHLFTAISCYSY